MSIQVHFFASLRERLGQDQLVMEWEAALPVTDLIAKIAREYESDWQAVLSAEDIMVAVNQTIVARSHAVQPGDEVAFLPPVTGG